MITKVYSIYDKATGAFMIPFYARSHGEAKRMFVNSARESTFAFNARDYELMYLSEFDDGIGQFGVPKEEVMAVPLRIMSGLEVVAMLEKYAASNPPSNGTAPTLDLKSVAEVLSGG